MTMLRLIVLMFVLTRASSLLCGQELTGTEWTCVNNYGMVVRYRFTQKTFRAVIASNVQDNNVYYMARDYQEENRWETQGSSVRWFFGTPLGYIFVGSFVDPGHITARVFYTDDPNRLSRSLFQVRVTSDENEAVNCSNSADSTKTEKPSPSDDALKQMRDPYGHKQPASVKRESGLAEPFKKNNESASTSGAKADAGDRSPSKMPPSKNTRDLTHAVWYPHEGSFNPRSAFPATFNLIAPDGGLVLTMSISIGKVTIAENGVAQGTLTVDVANVSNCTLLLSGFLYSKGRPIKDLGDKDIGAGERIVANGSHGYFYADANNLVVFKPTGFLHDCR